MNSVLERLLETHAPGVSSGLQKAFDTRVLDFKRDLYPLLAALDSEIPGIGMQYATWREGTPHYPFSMEFDSIVRPLRYVPYYLAGIRGLSMIARDVVQESGAHLESCVKELCWGKGLKGASYSHGPLGTLARKHEVRSLLGTTLSAATSEYCSVSWNEAKHNYSGGGPRSVITLEDAIGCYFVARALGAKVLTAAGRIEALTKAIQDAKDREQFYMTGQLPRHGDDDTRWSIRELDPNDRNTHT